MTQTENKISIAVDAMGGDFAPQEIVGGAVAAAQEGGIRPILVGPLDILEQELGKYDVSRLPIHCVNAENFVREEANPALMIRRMPNSSISVATKLLKSGEASAVVGATATGLLVASVIQNIGMIEDISRPVIGGVLSSAAPKTAIFDLGANTDCRPMHLLQFAVIGTVYVRLLLDIPNPTVALLNIGKEESKGNSLTRETYTMLSKSGLNFIGNIEGNGIITGQANVIICDGFVGNCVLKLTEGAYEMFQNLFRSKMGKHPYFGNLLKGKMKKILSSLVHPDSVGNGILWGTNGLVMKLHGHSRAEDVATKLRYIKLVAEKDVVNSIKTELVKVNSYVNMEKK